ncbi:hypothetical protein ACLPHM_06045 [Paenalcaligenes sp. Me131]|uniref:hypothetical protein n=1 Tax=Paenalcaligenes sp. Me131 TaxID=3392636 RepID=UPI003D284957
MRKEKCSCDGLMVASLLAGVALGAVIMVAIGAMITYDPKGVPLFFGAKWWEVMTAIGTTGAVVVALWQARKLSRLKEDENRKKITGVLSLISEAVQSLYWLASHASYHKNVYESFSVANFRNFQTSVDAIGQIPFYEWPYCNYHKVLNPVISQLRVARTSVMHVVDNKVALENLDGFIEEAKTAEQYRKTAYGDPVLKDIPKPGLHYLIPEFL